MSNDFPKYWVDEEIDPETGEIIENTANLVPVPVEEEIPLPTIAEQKATVTAATDISDESKGMLNSLIEMNSIAQTLTAIRNNETQEQRKTVITAWCENFIQSRMRNNATAELLKSRLLERLLNNLDNLDLDTTSRIYTDLSDVSSVDAQQAIATIMGSGGIPGVGSQQGGISLTINNATSDGATITNNTLNANPQQVGQLKEVNTLNSSIKAWNNIPLPKKKVVDVEYIEEKKD